MFIFKLQDPEKLKVVLSEAMGVLGMCLNKSELLAPFFIVMITPIHDGTRN